MTDKAAPETPAADAGDDAGQADGPVSEVPRESGEVPRESGEATPDLDDVKQKFRAALDRKRVSRNDGRSGGGGKDKITGAHGPAGGRRSFRRKSG